MKRSILHVDCNNFFASVESVYQPQLKNVPCAVAGRSEDRHGIILAKNELAKKYGVSTGEAVWQAVRKCPDLVTVDPHFDRYNKYSKLFKGICFRYTDLLESFGIDECWLDVTGNRKSPLEIAEEIRRSVKEEYGLTVSVGVSFNKVFAKLGSDMKKPDAVTVITEDDFRSKVWPLPVGDLLGVGRSVSKRLHSYGIETIGELADTDPDTLRRWFGRSGEQLYRYANGLDTSRVSRFDEKYVPKSVSSGSTPYRNIENDADARILITALSENIASQLRKLELRARTISVNVRGCDLIHVSHQSRFECNISDSTQIAEEAFRLYKEIAMPLPVRSLTVCAAELVPYTDEIQLDFSGEALRDSKKESVNRAVDMIRKRYGCGAVYRALLMQDRRLGMFDPKEIGDVHPVGFRNKA